MKNFIRVSICILLCFVLIGCTKIQKPQNVVVETPVPEQAVIITPTPIVTATPAPTPTPFIEPEPSGVAILIEPDKPHKEVVVENYLDDNNSELAFQVFDLINSARAQYGLNNLIYNNNLQSAADLRAKEISTKFSHTRPDGNSFDTAVSNLAYSSLGENLLMTTINYSSPDSIVQSWLNSEGHRNNILSSNFAQSAIGTYTTNGFLYIVQIFMG